MPWQSKPESPRWARSVARVAALSLPCMLAGCHLLSSSCHEPREYQVAKSVPPLKVPDTVGAPSTRGALRIPDVGATPRAPGKGEPCLDEPPSFYPNRPKPGLRKGAAKSAASAPAPAASEAAPAPADRGATDAAPDAPSAAPSPPPSATAPGVHDATRPGAPSDAPGTGAAVQGADAPR